MKTKLLLLLTLLVIGYSGCRKVKCPGFDATNTGWLPTKSEHQMVFINENFDTLRLDIYRNNISEDYSLKTCRKCDCEIPNKYVSTKFNNNYLIYMELRIDQFPDYDCIYYQFLDKIFIFKENKESFKVDEISYPYQDSTINGKTLKKLVIIDNSNNPDFDRITKIIASKEMGLIQFYDKEFDCTWKSIKLFQ